MIWLLFAIVIVQGLAICQLFESKKNLAQHVRQLELTQRTHTASFTAVATILERMAP